MNTGPFGPFSQWLRDNHYRSSTIKKTITSISNLSNSVEANPELGIALTITNKGPLQRYTTYLHAGPKVPNTNFTNAVLGLQLESVKAIKPKKLKKREKISFDEAAWGKLWHSVCFDTSPESRVIEVEMATGIRIGDALRIEFTPLVEAMNSTGLLQIEIKGGKFKTKAIAGAPETWKKLYEAWRKSPTKDVAKWISPRSKVLKSSDDYQAAYQKVRRHLNALATELGLTGHIHLHRLRRTVATKALAETKDIHAVSQLLDHSSINTTMTYVEEFRAKDVAELQRKISPTS